MPTYQVDPFLFCDLRYVPKPAFPLSILNAGTPSSSQHALPTDGGRLPPHWRSEEELEDGEEESEWTGQRIEVDVEREEDDLVHEC